MKSQNAQNSANLNENSQNSVNFKANSQNDNFASEKSTHPQTPSAREGAFLGRPSFHAFFKA